MKGSGGILVLMCNTGTCMKVLMKTKKNFSQNSLSSGQDFDHRPPPPPNTKQKCEILGRDVCLYVI
jgi:hypothetical protein